MMNSLLLLILVVVLLAISTTSPIQAAPLRIDMGMTGGKTFNPTSITSATTEFELYGSLSGTGCELKLSSCSAKNLNITGSIGDGCNIIMDTVTISGGSLAFVGSIGEGVKITMKNLNLESKMPVTTPALDWQPTSCKNCELIMEDSNLKRTYDQDDANKQLTKSSSACGNMTTYFTTACILAMDKMTFKNNEFVNSGMYEYAAIGLFIGGFFPVNNVDTLLMTQNTFDCSGTDYGSFFGKKFYLSVIGIYIRELSLQYFYFYENTMKLGGAESGFGVLAKTINNTKLFDIHDNSLNAIVPITATGTKSLQQFLLIGEEVNFTDTTISPGKDIAQGNFSFVHNNCTVQAKKAYGIRFSYKIRGILTFDILHNSFWTYNTQKSGGSAGLSGMPDWIYKYARVEYNLFRGKFFASYYAANIWSHQNVTRFYFRHNIGRDVQEVDKGESNWCYFFRFSDSKRVGRGLQYVELSNNSAFVGLGMTWSHFAAGSQALIETLNITNNTWHTSSTTVPPVKYYMYLGFIYFEMNITNLYVTNNYCHEHSPGYKNRHSKFIWFRSESKNKYPGSVGNGLIQNNKWEIDGYGNVIQFFTTESYNFSDSMILDNNEMNILETYTLYTSAAKLYYISNEKANLEDPHYGNFILRNSVINFSLPESQRLFYHGLDDFSFDSLVFENNTINFNASKTSTSYFFYMMAINTVLGTGRAYDGTPLRGRFIVQNNNITFGVRSYYFFYFRDEVFLTQFLLYNNRIEYNISKSGSSSYFLRLSTTSTEPFICKNFSVINNYIVATNSYRLYFLYGRQFSPSFLNISGNEQYLYYGKSYSYPTSYWIYTYPTSSTSTTAFANYKVCTENCYIENNIVYAPYKYWIRIGAHYYGNFYIRKNKFFQSCVASDHEHLQCETIQDYTYFVNLYGKLKLYEKAKIIIEENYLNTSLSQSHTDTSQDRYFTAVSIYGGAVYFNAPDTGIYLRRNHFDAFNVTGATLFATYSSYAFSCGGGATTNATHPTVRFEENILNVTTYGLANFVWNSKNSYLCRWGQMQILSNQMFVKMIQNENIARAGYYKKLRSVSLIWMESYIRGGSFISTSSSPWQTKIPGEDESILVMKDNIISILSDENMKTEPVLETSLFYISYASGASSSSNVFVASIRNNTIEYSKEIALTANKLADQNLLEKIPVTSFFLFSNKSTTNYLKKGTWYLEGNKLYVLRSADLYASSSSSSSSIEFSKAQYAYGRFDAATMTKPDSSETRLFVGPECNLIYDVQVSSKKGETSGVGEAGAKQSQGSMLWNEASKDLMKLTASTCDTVTKSVSHNPTASKTFSTTKNTTKSLSGSDLSKSFSEWETWSVAKTVSNITETPTHSISQTEHTSSSSKTISLIPPKVRLGMTAEKVEEEVKQVATATAVTSVLAAPTAALTAARGMAIFSLMNCPGENAEGDRWNEAMMTPPGSLLPNVGFGSKDGKYARGAIMGFMLVFAVGIGLSLLMGYVLEKKRRATVEAEHKKAEESREFQRQMGMYNEFMEELREMNNIQMPERSIWEGAVAQAPAPWLLAFVLSQTLPFWAIAAGMVCGTMRIPDVALGLIPLLCIAGVGFHVSRKIDKILFSKHGPRVARSLVHRPKDARCPSIATKMSQIYCHPIMRFLFIGFYIWQAPRTKNMNEFELTEELRELDYHGGSDSDSDENSSGNSSEKSNSDSDDDDEENSVEEVLSMRQKSADLIPRMRGTLTKMWGPLLKNEALHLEREARMDLSMPLQTNTESYRRRGGRSMAEQIMEEEDEEIQSSWLLRLVHNRTKLWKFRARLCAHWMYVSSMLTCVVGLCQGFAMTGPGKYCPNAIKAIGFWNVFGFALVLVMRPYIVPFFNFVVIFQELVIAVCSLIGAAWIAQGNASQDLALQTQLWLSQTLFYGSFVLVFLSGMRVILLVFKLRIVTRADIFRAEKNTIDELTVALGAGVGGGIAADVFGLL